MENSNYSCFIEKLRENSQGKAEFGHFSNKTYLDHAANAIYMNSLIKDYHDKLTFSNDNNNNFLFSSFFSNPHSHNLSGVYTNMYIDSVRQKVLRLFKTNQNEFDVVFVMNATHGLKLLAEVFNFTEQIESNQNSIEEILNESSTSSSFAYLNDNHTSVVGMREIIWSNHIFTNTYCLFENENFDCEFNFKLIESPLSELDKSKFKENISLKNRSLFVYPAQSNFNGRKYNLEIINDIHKNGLKLKNKKIEKSEWFVCLDSASYVSTSELDLSVFKPDFLVVSFYKIFGFPTGIGALIIKKTDRVKNSLTKKSYFGGGTVSMALIDDNKVCYRNCSIKDSKNKRSIVNNFRYHEFLEDGTLSYLQIIGVGIAIDKFEKLGLNFKLIKIHTENLTKYCVEKMNALKHLNGKPLVEVYRKEINQSITNDYGPIIAFNVKSSLGTYIGFRLVDKLAQENQIYLRTGCFCNIGACQMFMKHLRENETFLKNFKQHGHECGDHIDLINDLPTGALRISFGYCSIKQDADKFIKFLEDYFIEKNSINNFNGLVFNIDNLKIDREKKVDTNNLEIQYFKINHIYIYPIKSCAPMKISKNWSINKSGFIYDRNWIIVDSNGLPLTQKRYKSLTKIKPFIDLDKNLLRLEYENEMFEISLETEHEIKDNKLITINNLTGFDQGNEVSTWLTTRVFKSNNNVKLIRVLNDDSSFVNKAQYLLINENSIQTIRNYLNLDLEESSKEGYYESYIDEFLYLQFRPNIVVSLLHQSNEKQTGFDEELWSNVKILNKSIQLNIVDNCTRCQMININQSDEMNDSLISKYAQMLLKQLYKLKSNSKFGIYLSKNTSQNLDSDNCKVDLGNINNELSIGDIGIAYKFKYK